MPTTPTDDSHHITIDNDPLYAMSSTTMTPTNSGQLPLPSLRDVGTEINRWEPGGVKGMRNGVRRQGNGEQRGRGKWQKKREAVYASFFPSFYSTSQ